MSAEDFTFRGRPQSIEFWREFVKTEAFSQGPLVNQIRLLEWLREQEESRKKPKHKYEECALSDGPQEWFRDDKLHRDDDLPALVWADGTKMWFRDGKLHRADGLPAVVWADGDMVWYSDGKRHRDGGLPAVVYADGRVEFWVDGKQVIR